MTTAIPFGAMPVGWRMGRIKDLVGGTANGVWGDDPLGDGRDVHCVRAADFDRESLTVRPEKLPLRRVDPRALRKHRLSPGDLVWEKSGGGETQPVGLAVKFDLAAPAVCSNFCTRVTPSVGTDSRYLGYVFAAAHAAGLNQRSIKQTTGLQNLDGKAFLAEVWPIPGPAEQRRIADFLDAETRKIGALVSKKLRLLSLFEEKINSRILECIGASRLVGNSDSAIPVLPVRRLLSKLARPALPASEVITAFRDGQVTARSKRRADGYTLSSHAEAQGQYVELGDVVIHGLDGFAGAIGTSESAGNCSLVYHVCIPCRGGNALFLGRMLRVLAVSGYLGLFATSTRERAVDFRNWDLFGRIPIPDVPLRWQEEVGEWISSARPLRVAVERSFALAEERRRTLITAAVTGQIDVATAERADA
ncbi:hypothetical protein O7607_27505 [Micromonospora sp. WMMA1949]|uniref:restriction endonuclease subunit S n=1 Tax=Micromonospora sp. WMMA1949 TaxID=3015162 RepID=UPI0022B64CA9|nr:hypothetical protein [Micromonospora sp. WMMA1949]MCZ7429511.1 hypothetical protein [Micromonospora sp. WMMA1949]